MVSSAQAGVAGLREHGEETPFVTRSSLSQSIIGRSFRAATRSALLIAIDRRPTIVRGGHQG
jgi:hypothetical protein